MPDNSLKKQSNKTKNDSKEQRKLRQPRQAHTPSSNNNKKKEHGEETSKESESNNQQGNSILITDSANSQFKNKEIKSNWDKYEIQIESYEEIQEHQNMGANYEDLCGVPLQTSAHFQFKHEKSWDTNTTITQYDKFFDINMDQLHLALSTIQFFERNTFDPTLLTESEKRNIELNVTRAKQKYLIYNTSSCEPQMGVENVNADRKADLYSVPESDVQFIVTQEQSPQSNAKKAADEPDLEKHLGNVQNKMIHIFSVEQDNKESKDEKQVEILVDEVIISPSEHDIERQAYEEPSEKTPMVEKASPQRKKEVIKPAEDLEKWLDDFLDS